MYHFILKFTDWKKSRKKVLIQVGKQSNSHCFYVWEKEDEVPFNVRLNGIKTKLSAIERDIFRKQWIENQELDGQIDLFLIMQKNKKSFVLLCFAPHCTYGFCGV